MSDEDMQKFPDYAEGQKEAAHRVLVEIVNLLRGYDEDIRIIGGWVPDLLYPDSGHVGSLDVDILLNHNKIAIDSYENIEKVLSRVGYRKHPEKYFSFVRDVKIAGVVYSVDIDFLAGKYGGTSQNKRSQHLSGLKALKATGGDFAFDTPPVKKKIEAERPDGALDIAHLNIVSIVPFFVMKTAALNRQKPKDAYDMYFCMEHYKNGMRGIVDEFLPYREREIIKTMLDALSEKFASPNHVGPVDIASFLGLTGEEREMMQRDAFEKIQYLIHKLR